MHRSMGHFLDDSCGKAQLPVQCYPRVGCPGGSIRKLGEQAVESKPNQLLGLILL